jgi:hypothetical protein
MSHTVRRGTWWTAAAVVLATGAAEDARARELLAETSVARTIPGQEYLVFRIDPAAGTIVFEDPTLRELSADQLAAVDAVPAWLRPDLSATFWRTREGLRPDELARMILEAEDDTYVDEIAFLVAHLAPEDLRRMDREIIPETVRRIYEYDATIEFADLVEHGDADDPERYTTVAYRILRDGAEDSFELPRDLYYWYVVHPALDGEDLVYVDPERHRLADPPAGWHWRSYFWTDDPDRSYQAPWVLIEPDRIATGTFDAWSLGGRPRAFSHFVDLEGPAIDVVRADGGEPVTVAFVRGDGGCGSNDNPNGDGTYFATLSPVELAAANGEGTFLRNLVRAGGGNGALLPEDIRSWDPWAMEDRRILIVRDRIPFDLATDPVEDAVREWGRDYDVLGSADLAGLALSADAPPRLNLAYNKIVVPSDQPRALYEALVAAAEKLERFVDYGGTLEIHGATRPEDDWSDLRLPGGIRCAPQDGTNEHDSLAPYGWPLLADAVAPAQYLWDGVGGVLSGDRALDPDGTAIDRLGWWVSRNITWSIQEKLCWKRGAVVTRYLIPQEIVYDHAGNCGEIQDVWSSAGRTVLVGIWNVGTVADDHMWDEFRAGEQWLPLQVGWSNGPTHIAQWNHSYDADVGGSKTIAGMDGFRGDGLAVHALARYEHTELDGHLWNDYSEHVTLDAAVEDAAGNPVDGALVLIATPDFYDPDRLAIATFRYTGPDGRARIVVGEGNDYYLQVTSSLGAYPDSEHVAPWVTAAEAVADAVFEDTFVLGGTIPVPAPEVVPATGDLAGSVVAEVSASREIVQGESPLSSRTHTESFSPGEVQVLLLTEAEYADFRGGADFAALAEPGRGASISVEEDLHGDGPFLLVVANRARVTMEQEVAIDVELYSPAGDGGGEVGGDVPDDAAGETGEDDVPADEAADGEAAGPADGEEVAGLARGGGCACSVPAVAPGAAWLFGLLAAALGGPSLRGAGARGRRGACPPRPSGGVPEAS